MDDQDLNALKNIKTPPPERSAKERALDAALMAFDEFEEKNVKAPQGILAWLRPMFILLTDIWEWMMNRRSIIGAAVATVIMVPVAVGVFMESQETRAPIVGSKQEVSKSETRSKKQDTSRQVVDITKPVTIKEKPAEKVVAVKKPAFQPSPKISLDGSNQRLGYSMHDARLRKNRAGGQFNLYTQPLPHGIVNRDSYLGDGERFSKFENNPLRSVTEHPVSTFSIDVDTSSYAFVRRSLNEGRLPKKDAVRVEELINYFSYNYPRPDGAEKPFQSSVAVYETPWNSGTKLLHIGIKGHDIVPETKPRSNLVFLIDVSGSMNSRDKLPLLKTAFKLLVSKLDENDSVAIVTYAGRAATVLEPTKVSEKVKILNALDQLKSGGSTAGAQGVKQAYALAEAGFDKEGVNRVILATDGDFNVGIRDPKELKSYIEKKRKSGIFLSVLGFGRGNYNDALMQTLAQNGNGTASYIDTLKEAQKVLVNEASSTLFTIAKDVKIQIEFNPEKISEYRLIGYETRKLKREDFKNDKVDAGDIGSGHTVTAIYEITPKGSKSQRIDDLRYGKKESKDGSSETSANSDEYAFLKLRYKLPKEDKSKLITIPITKELEKEFASLSDDMRFAASVAAFGQKLRDSQYIGSFDFEDVLKLATKAKGTDKFGYRSEFLGLIRLAKDLEKAQK